MLVRSAPARSKWIASAIEAAQRLHAADRGHGVRAWPTSSQHVAESVKGNTLHEATRHRAENFVCRPSIGMVHSMGWDEAVANVPGTEVLRGIEPLSRRWFGVDFSALLPWQFGPITVEWGSPEELLPFIVEHYRDLFGLNGQEGRWRRDPMTAAKLRFLADADLFVLRRKGKIVGDLIAHPSDWNTYYLRSLAVLPEHRGLGTVPLLLERIAEILAAVGVERIEGDVSPANRMNVLAQTRLGYIATGTFNSDRWGALVRMTKFLHVEAEGVFHDQFCAGSWPRCLHPTTMGSERRTP